VNLSGGANDKYPITHTENSHDNSKYGSVTALYTIRKWNSTTIEGSQNTIGWLIRWGLMTLSAQITYITPWVYEIYCVGLGKNLQ